MIWIELIGWRGWCTSSSGAGLTNRRRITARASSSFSPTTNDGFQNENEPMMYTFMYLLYFHPYLCYLTSNIWFSNNIELNRQSFVISVPWVSLVLTPENKLLWQWPFLFFFKCCAIAKDEASALCFKGYFSCYRWLVHFFPHLGHLGAIYFSQPHGSASVTWHFYNFTWLLLRLSVFFYFVFVVCNSAFVNFHLRF